MNRARATNWSSTLLAVSISFAFGNVHGAIFADVPDGHQFQREIEVMYSNGITTGCAPGLYCPLANVTRAQMATFMGRALYGRGATLPNYPTAFPDVPEGSTYENWITQTYRDGVMGECPTISGYFCPDQPIKRQEMAKVLLKAKYGGNYAPPPPGPQVFADVPITSAWAPWIHQLAREEITFGCTSTAYCPNEDVSREQMAVFLTRTLSLLAPTRSLLTNYRFEFPYVGTNSFWRNSNGATGTALNSWTFINSAGVTAAESAYSIGNPRPQESRQVALIENTGEIRQTFSVPTTGWYGLDFLAAQRTHTLAAPQTLEFWLDGVVVSHQPANDGYVGAFHSLFLTAGVKELRIKGSPASAGTAFVDDVRLMPREWGFADPGLVFGRVKSPYLSKTAGTVGDPLERGGCLFTTADGELVPTGVQCEGGPTVFSAAHPFVLNTTWSSTDAYWVWGMNQEYCNMMPNLSMPRRLPGQGLAGFEISRDVWIGETFNRAHLVLNTLVADPAQDPSCLPAAIPFMSFGAQADRGNGKPIVAINPAGAAPSSVSFSAKLHDVVGQPNFFILSLLSSWPDARGRHIPRQIQLDLFASPGFAHNFNIRKWNWPIHGDFWPNGGTEIVYLSAENVRTMCQMNLNALTNLGQELQFNINVDQLFRCVAGAGGFSNPVPSTLNIPVTGVHWAVENVTYSSAPTSPGAITTSPGAIWVSVHGMSTN